jgi:hypothetical protein
MICNKHLSIHRYFLKPDFAKSFISQGNCLIPHSINFTRLMLTDRLIKHIPDEIILQKSHYFRNQKVMPESDLANLNPQKQIGFMLPNKA